MTENDVIAAMKRCYSFCRCIRGLDETEWRLLRLRYGLNGGPKHTLDEIAKELGTNAEAVSAIERGITSTLKTYAYRMKPSQIDIPSDAAEKPRCENCRFWDGDTETDVFGVCRIRRPLIDDRGNTIWPETTSDDWCGEFQLKETSND